MIRYLIKNNFKLMFRNTWSVVFMLLGPILVIAVLSSAFSELMKSYESVDEFAVGYRVQDENKTLLEGVTAAGAEAGILFYEYPEGDIKDVMTKNELAGFVELAEGEYTVYTSADHEVEGITLEYFMNKVMNAGISVSLQLQGQPEIELPVKQLDYMPAIDSVDYYGIIYIVYFGWCGLICATGVLSCEKKYGIERRFQVSAISEAKNYLGKMIPTVLTGNGDCGGDYSVALRYTLGKTSFVCNDSIYDDSGRSCIGIDVLQYFKQFGNYNHFAVCSGMVYGIFRRKL